jgi:hypothetical protein
MGLQRLVHLALDMAAYRRCGIMVKIDLALEVKDVLQEL